MPGEGISLRSTCAPNGDARLAQSPLQIFVNAKKEINEIFSEIEEYVKETVVYIHGKFLSSLVRKLADGLLDAWIAFRFGQRDGYCNR